MFPCKGEHCQPAFGPVLFFADLRIWHRLQYSALTILNLRLENADQISTGSCGGTRMKSILLAAVLSVALASVVVLAGRNLPAAEYDSATGDDRMIWLVTPG